MEMIQPLLALICLLMGSESAPSGPAWAGWLGVALYLLLGWTITRAGVNRHLASEGGKSPYHPPVRVGIVHLALWVVLTFMTPWGPWIIATTGDVPFVSLLCGFLPYVAHRVIRCFAAWPAEAASWRTWTKREYVVFSVRVLALPVVPIVVLQGLRDVLLNVDAFAVWLFAYPDVLLPILMLTLLVVVFSIAPVLVRWILGARPLEAGPLRTRLDAYGERSGFRPSNILVWRTGNTVTNALFIGIIPLLRYVVLTDALMARLTDDQVEAVYAHEAGHGMRRHTQLYVVMAAGFLLVNTMFMTGIPVFALEALEGLGQEMAATIVQVLVVGMMVLLLAAFLFIGIGWLSRRFETEADLWAVSTLDKPESFASALEAVGLHLGILRTDRGGMRHFGIGTRIGLINRYRCEPEFRDGFDRLLRRCRLGVLGLLAVGAIGLACYTPGALAVGHARLAYVRGRDAENDSDPVTAATLFTNAITKARSAAVAHPAFARLASEQEAAALASLGDLHLKTGEYEQARGILDQMRARVREGDVLGEFNTDNLTVILDAVMEKPDVAAIRHLIRELDALVASREPDPRSVALTHSDLWLALRSAGETDRPRGAVDAYSAAARLLRAWFKNPDTPPSADALDAARRDLERNVFRQVLFDRAAPEALRALVSE